MSPLIQEMVGLEPEEALNYQWFDMTPVYKPEQVIDGDILEKPLPFPFTALVCAYEDKKVLLLANRVGQVTAVVGWQLDKNPTSPPHPSRTSWMRRESSVGIWTAPPLTTAPALQQG